MVGLRPLKADILVRVQVSQQIFEKCYNNVMMENSFEEIPQHLKVKEPVADSIFWSES